MTLFELVTGAWAIEPSRLLEIQAIYLTHLRGEKIDVAAVEARLGRPLANEQQDYTLEAGGIAVLRASGVMAPKANLMMQLSGGISTQMATRQLQSAAADPKVRGLILALDTPGGNVIGTPEMAEAIFAISQEKPIVVYSDGQLLSAGYWAGSAASAVYISGPTVQAGSIGVVVNRSFDPSAAVQQEHIVAGKYKRLARPNEPLSDESRAVVQADVDYVYTLFVDAVAQYRGLTTSQQVLDHMADGRVFRGQQAIDAGLVDGVSTLDALVESMATDPATYAKRRKAVFAVAAPKSSSAGAAPKDKSPTREKGKAMPGDNPTPITRASFEQDHADLYAQIRNEAATDAQAAAAVSERERIQAVLAIGAELPGHETLLQTLAFDGKTSAAEASLAVLKAEGAARTAAIAAHKQDAPAAVRGSAAPEDNAQPTPAAAAAQVMAVFNAANGIKSHG